MENNNSVNTEIKTERRKKERMILVTFKRLSKSKSSMIGLVVILILVLSAIFAPVIAPYEYDKADYYNVFSPPTKVHIFGTDELGRDIFSRLLYGSRDSLRIGFIAVAISSVCGIALGSVCGYFGGVVDTVVMRLVDIIQAIPGLIMAIAIGAALGPGFNNLILSLTIGSVAGYVRMTRASVMNIRKMEYLEAATAINCRHPRIITRHILPNALSPMIVQMTMGIAGAILMASQMSFVGLGVQPPKPEWGAMLSAGRNYIRDYPHMCVFPGVTIMISVLSLNMIGDGLRDALDPKLKN